ncbi:MAG TPA: hypothetical protein VIH55_06780 [Acidimicrobiia bacterium]
MTPRGRARLSLLVAMTMGVLVAGCGPTGDPKDTTAPEFLQITVTVQRVTDGFNEPPVDATSGLTLDDVQRNRRIVVTATVADDQSGIKQVRLRGDTDWDCITPGDDLAEHKHGTLGGSPDEERLSSTTVSGRPALRNVTFTLDPFEGNALRLVCAATDESTELLMGVTLVAINGNDVEGTSPGISIEYQPRPPG